MLPDDLVAPFQCDDHADAPVWLASVEEVVAAAARRQPLVSPCCGRSFAVGDLSLVSFFSQSAWDVATDDDPPAQYRVAAAFPVPGSG